MSGFNKAILRMAVLIVLLLSMAHASPKHIHDPDVSNTFKSRLEIESLGIMGTKNTIQSRKQKHKNTLSRILSKISADIVIGQPDFENGSINRITADGLYQPWSVFIDVNGKLFIADRSNNRVLIYNSLPTSNNQPADVVVGQPDMNSGRSGTSSTQLNRPNDVYSDGTRLYIADRNNHRVLIYNSIPSENGTAADVVIGQANMDEGQSGLAADKLNQPTAVFAQDGKLFISDRDNHRVLIFNATPTFNGASADVVIGQQDMTSNTLGTNASQIYYPYGIWIENGQLFLADFMNNRVLIYNNIPTSNGTSADVVIGQVNMDTNDNDIAADRMHRPSEVYSDGTRLFIADSYNHRVLIYNTIPYANGASADIVIGQNDLNTNNNTTGPDALDYPFAICGYQSKIFISDCNNNRILIYNSIPSVNGASANVVIGQTDFYDNGANTTDATTLANPQCIAFDDDNRIYIADSGNRRLLIFNQLPSVNGAPADIVVGQPDMSSRSGGLGPDRLGWFEGLDIYDGKLFIGDGYNHRVLIFNSLPVSNGASADIVIGQPDMVTSESNCTSTNFGNYVAGIDASSSGLFVADYNNHRILHFDPIPVANGAAANLVIGQPDFTTSEAGCSATALDNPYGVCYDGSHLFICDTDNNRVLVYNEIPESNGEAADVVIGQEDMTTNESGVAADKISRVDQIFSDMKRVYIPDFSNNRLLIYKSVPKTNGTDADVVIGQDDFNNSESGCTADAFNLPLHVKIDDDANMYVVDFSNNRVLVFYPSTWMNLVFDAPSVPENLTAVPGDQEITLTWSANTETLMDCHKIYRSTSQGFSPSVSDYLSAVEDPDTTFTDTGLTNGQTYYYRISAVDAAGNESEFSDEVSAIPYSAITVTSTADSGPGTLRQALLDAVRGSVIDFDPTLFPIDNPATIFITSESLPPITQGYMTMDASYAGVILDGSDLDNGIGITIKSDSNNIMGMRIEHFDYAGISVGDRASYNQIGGVTASQGNVIGNNEQYGIHIHGSHSTNNQIIGNYIGTDAKSTGMPNNVGVLINLGANENTIGGYEDTKCNFLIFNRSSGICVYDDSSNHNSIIGNIFNWDFWAIDLINSKSTNVIGNSIVHNQRGISADNATVNISSNIIYYSSPGIYGSSLSESITQLNYNNFWNSSYSGFSPGTADVSADPLFINPALNDYRLRAFSPCIDAGDPDIPLDPDGTRADIGALYFDQRTPPPAVVSGIQITPGNEQITLSWSPSAETDVDYYQIYRSLISDFTPSTSDSLTTVSATEISYIDTGLVNGQTYYYRITAVCILGLESAYSEEISAAPTGGLYAPQITHTPMTTASKGQPLTVTADLTDNSSVASATLYYRKGGASQYSNLNMSPGSTYQATIPSSSVTEKGLEYYITAVDDSGHVSTEPATNPLTSPHVVQVTFSSLSCPNATPAESYRMISVPGDLDHSMPDSVLADDLGALDRTEWRLLRRVQSGFVEYGINAFTGFEPGSGFWLITRTAKSWDTPQGKSVSTAQDVTLTLTPGWNQIGNPFAFAVDWDDVVKNGDVESPVGYEGTGNSTSGYQYSRTRLTPWKGYYVKNLESGSVTIDIPPVEGSGSIAKTVLKQGEWKLKMTAESDAFTDNDNVIGFLLDAEDAWDPNDFSEAPFFANYLSLYFPHEDWDKYPGLYTGDFRSAKEEGEVWDFRVRTSQAHAQVTLKPAEIQHLPEHFKIILIDESARLQIPLDDGSSYAFITGEKEEDRPFRILVGREDFVSEKAEAFEPVPKTFVLTQNYPNPFNPETKINYELPGAEHVKLFVYNILGRRILKLVDKEQSAGRYTVTWDGRDTYGQTVSAGVYIIRLEAGAFVGIRKMVLTK